MKLEDQVCSLDLAKRLKELGVKQKSAFYWVATLANPSEPWRPTNWDVRDREYCIRNHQWTWLTLGERDCDYIFSAFTQSELNKLLAQKGQE